MTCDRRHASSSTVACPHRTYYKPLEKGLSTILTSRDCVRNAPVSHPLPGNGGEC
ncbi:hypothetical protein WN55_07350 [Dufourea novaeangliae]|uniref:Uncharacterized protein n=1 Tax=Dufourea novaeangliae TaxID=178035 RepID=A0A154P2M9_DUFNO|nr:hypothetical protein WN55_07350 [Dufourea novaeangliae]